MNNLFSLFKKTATLFECVIVYMEQMDLLLAGNNPMGLSAGQQGKKSSKKVNIFSMLTFCPYSLKLLT